MKFLDSLQKEFTILMIILICVLTLPVFLSGIYLINKIIYKNSQKILTIELNNLIEKAERRYLKLKRFGLEDSEFHKKEIKEITLKEFKKYTFENSGKVFVITKDGKSIIYPSKISTSLLHLLDSNKNYIEFSINGEKVFAVYKFYPRWNSYVGIYINKNEIFHLRDIFLRIMFLVFCFGIFISLLIVNFLNTRIVQPTITLTDFAKKISSGQLHTEIKGEFKNEFQELKNSISRMVNSLKKMITAYQNQIKIIKERESELEEEKRKLSTTLTNIEEGIITIDKDNKVILINDKAQKLLNINNEDAYNKSIFDILKISSSITLFELITNVKLKKEPISLEKQVKLLNSKGNERFITITISPIILNNKIQGMVIVIRDITDKLKMEQEILKLEKLQSIQILAGGIAHDFNNILMGIVGNISILQEMLKTHNNEKINKKLDQILKACERAKSLSYQLLTFARGGEPVKKVMNLKELLIDNIEFLLRGTKIKFEYSIPDDLYFVEIDSGHFSQVIQNIVINSREAIKDNGIIKVECRNLENYKLIPYDKISDWVEIKISDNGIGIPEEYIKKVFDPFFSTKELGSGLGLAICHSIITKHDGFIEIDSQQGKGTTVKIYLPACKKIYLEKNLKKTKEKNINKKIKILIIDDNEDVREVMKEMIEILGHEVVCTENGEKGIEIYKKEKFDLVITDLTIPGGMSGDKIAQEILKINKNAKIIVASGYSESVFISHYEQYGFCEVLKKPIRLDELKEKIIKIIN